MSTSSPTILITDDDVDDQFMLQRALGKAKIDNPVLVFNAGEDLMDFLSSSGAAAISSPAILFLDLNMPGMTGFDVLTALAGRADRHQIVPIVVSSSDREEDIERAMRLGAVAYHVKFPEPSAFPRIISNALDRVRQESHGFSEMSRASA